MRILFISNYYNHHQSAFSEAMYALTDGEYRFIETEQMSEERKNMGWGMKEKPGFVLDYTDEPAKTQAIIDEADFVILGSAPEKLLATRHRAGKINFRYSERFYKKGCPAWQIPLRAIKNYMRFGRYKNDYMLCASAYTAADLAITHTFIGKTYKWGYFPPFKELDLQKLFAKKEQNETPSVLWAGRLIGWKHPDASIRVAERLRDAGYTFTMNIIGNGEMQAQLERMIDEKQLGGCVSMLGSMKPEQVREHMEQADIYLFTSDFNEGWGAVLNESMNSGCAVVASHAIGSVPFLISDGKNGLIYHNENQEDLHDKVELLVKDAALRKRLGQSAYVTMQSTWNANIAAERFLLLANELKQRGTCNIFESGPCSAAQILKNDWYTE